LKLRERIVQENRKNRSRLTWVAGICVLAVGAALQAPAAAAQSTSVAAVSAKPDVPAPPAHSGRATAARTKPDKPAVRYFIEFRSRNALSYGHAYVVYGKLDPRGKLIDPQVGGIHPASNSVVPYMLGHVVPVPAEHGASDGDLEEQYVSARYRVVLGEAEYNRVVAYIHELEASTPVWHAFLYSCTSFLADVAKFMGLRTPPSAIYPEVFVNNLRAMNSGRDEEITLIPRVQWGMAPAAPTADEDPNATSVLSGSDAR
jgi:hypothetical protein